MTKKIGIIGAGAIGCFVGAQLLHDKKEVHFLGRDRLGNLIKESGLTISDLQNKSTHIQSQNIIWHTNPDELPLLDIVIMATKSHDTEKSINAIRSKISDDTVIVSLQNGLKNPPLLRSLFPKNTIVTGMVPYNVIQVDNSPHFKQTSNGLITLNSEVAELRALDFIVNPEITAIQWGKLIKNLNNALNALSNIPLVNQLKDQRERKLLSMVITEALNVLDKNSIPVKNNSIIPIKIFPFVLKLPTSIFSIVSSKELKIDPKARLSMWQDLELKRKTEIEFLNGEIVDLAAKSHMQAPVNQKIVELIKIAESGDLNSARSQYQELLKSI